MHLFLTRGVFLSPLTPRRPGRTQAGTGGGRGREGWCWLPLGMVSSGCDDCPWLPKGLCVWRECPGQRAPLGLLELGWVEVRKAGSLMASGDQLPQGSCELLRAVSP